MQKYKFKQSLFIFRRDLRLHDNIGLINCLKQSENVIPCFIFDNIQITPENNKYFSHNQVQFMIESLDDLNQQLQIHGSSLRYFKGDQKTVIQQIIKETNINCIFTNEDYTPYSISRDLIIKSICEENKIQFIQYEDIMLLNKNAVLLDTGLFYQKFTPYYRKAMAQKVTPCIKNTYSNYIPVSSPVFPSQFLKDPHTFYTANVHLEVHGGRQLALKIINNIKNNTNYVEDRNNPSASTTKLSAYLKFGCLSIREVFFKIKEELKQKSEELIRQLYWRDFYLSIVYHYPHVVNNAMKPKYDKVQWANNQSHILAWQTGNTGVPIVDAGMIHMNTTGYMPNRLRMITANYLVKVLLVDWRIGEKYFATQLVDYDLPNNNGGWQWSSGSGADSQPYFRIFNPTLQSSKFDKDAKYIKKWMPKLKSVLPANIHNWEKTHIFNQNGELKGYVPLIKSYDIRKKMVLKEYSRVFQTDDEKMESEEETPIKKSLKKLKKE